ncbi:P-loop containing dynein motor region D4-domain-containing protein [Baffinella frigidus]|nr:P-loop containing dynein motor region D4-domain-containing protein [Cryptophyta sp. CCMP2293]
MSVDPKVIDGADDVFRVWVHECKRIFQDRLIDNTDQDWFHKMQGECANKHFKKPMDKIMGDGADGNGLLLYGDFILDSKKAEFSVYYTGADGNGLLLYGDFILDSKKAEAEYENRKYQPVASMDLATSIIKEFMEDYNQISKSPMELVLFGYVVEHICRHALLVGVGGSGRQSLTRLAAFISDFAIFSIEITKNYGTEAWFDDLKTVFTKAGFDDLKTVFTKAGSEDKRMVFLFTDSQIVMESQLEDVNNILNTGSVPNLFAADEVMGILDAVSTKARAAGRGLTPTDTFEFFIDQCRKNMHVVLCMSPIGSGLRDRIRQFPSLVNCCTIDWFFPWPAEGLIAVAQQALTTIGLEPKIADSALTTIGLEPNIADSVPNPKP